MDNHEVAAALAQVSSEIRALRNDIEGLRREVRSNDSRLRADLARTVSRQNSDITDSKKKSTGSLNLLNTAP
jgi:hypothetical protein